MKHRNKTTISEFLPWKGMFRSRRDVHRGNLILHYHISGSFAHKLGGAYLEPEWESCSENAENNKIVSFADRSLHGFGMSVASFVK